MANLSSKTGFTPNLTQISLANNATTTIQNMSAYDGQMLTGFVYVDATTDKRAFCVVQVIKNGAGTYEVAAADVSGDDLGGSPIVTFSMSGSDLQATLPNFTGFTSAYIRFKLDAPALGATFPLQVDGSNVTLATASVQGAYKAGQAPGLTTGATIGAGYVGQVLTVELGVYFSSTSQGSFINVTGLSLILTAGSWLVLSTGFGSTAFTAANPSAISSLSTRLMRDATQIAITSDMVIFIQGGWGGSTRNGNASTGTYSQVAVVNTNVNTTIQVQAQHYTDNTLTSPSFGIGVGSKLVAVRIA